MAKSNFVQNKFVSGELSPNIKARTDLDQYYQGMETAENVVTTPQGGVKRRMGSEFVDVPMAKATEYDLSSATITAPEGGTVANLTDNDTETKLVTLDSLGTQDPYVVVHVDLGSAKHISFVDFTDIKLTLDKQGDKFLLQSSTDNTNWTTEDELNTLTNYEQTIRATVTAPVTVGQYNTYTRQYWRLARVGGVNDCGTAKVSLAEIDFLQQDNAAPDGKFKMHKFEVDKANSFLLFFTPTNLRIFRATDTATTFVQDVNHGLGDNFPNRVAVNENVLLMFNKNAAPRRLVYNYNNDGLFFYDTPTFTNIPKYDFDDRLSPAKVNAEVSITFPSDYVAGDKYQLEIDGVLSKEIVYHGDANIDQQSATAIEIQVNLQEMPVFGESGITVTRDDTVSDKYNIVMAGESANDYDQMTGFPTEGTTHVMTFSDYTRGNNGKEDIWSSTRGYPNLGVFAQGRLWIGGTRDKPQVLLASEAGNYFNFLVDRGEANEGFLFTINGSKSAIVDVTGGRGVTVFTEGAEFSITGNTPATLDAQQQTQHGSFSADVPTLALDGTTLFIDRNGRNLRQFIYDYREEGFRSVDMSVLSSHMISNPVDMDAVTATTSEDANYVFIINGDGTAVVMNTLRDQDITGFVRFDQKRAAVSGSDIYGSNVDFAGSEDTFLQVVSVNNVLHVLSKNQSETDNYFHAYSISRMTFDHKLDHSIKYEPSDLGGGNYHPATLDGLKHIRTTTPFYLIAGNTVLPPRYFAPNTNSVALSDAERQLNVTIEVGRNFVPTVKPMPLSTILRSGDNIQMALKRVDRMNLRVIDSAGVNIDGVAVPVREFGDASNSPLNTSLVPTTGIIEDNNGGNGWGREVVPKITVPDPTPFHLLAIDYEISS